MEDPKSLPKLTIEEELSFESSLRYIFNHYSNIALYGKSVTAKKLVAAADHHQKAIIKYAVLEDPEEKSLQGIPVRAMNSRADGIDLMVVCTDTNEYEYVERAKKWAGSSVGVFALVSDSIMLDSIRLWAENPGDKWPTRMYLLCTSERTGSTMLCFMLRRTRLLGIPGELFTRFLKQNVDEGVISYEQIVPEIFKRYQSPNGVFGVKMHQYQFSIFNEAINSLRAEDKPLVDNLLANAACIYLVRRNLYEQSISLWRAQQTRTYHVFKNRPSRLRLSQLRKLINPRVAIGLIKGFLSRGSEAPPPYNYAALKEILLRLAGDRDRWRTFFRTKGISPLTIIYEDFASRMPETIMEIANEAGVHLPEEKAIIDPVSIKMADEYTMEILGKFKIDLQHEDSRLFDRIERIITEEPDVAWK